MGRLVLAIVFGCLLAVVIAMADHNSMTPGFAFASILVLIVAIVMSLTMNTGTDVEVTEPVKVDAVDPIESRVID